MEPGGHVKRYNSIEQDIDLEKPQNSNVCPSLYNKYDRLSTKILDWLLYRDPFELTKYLNHLNIQHQIYQLSSIKGSQLGAFCP